MKYYLGNNTLQAFYFEINEETYSLWCSFYREYKSYENIVRAYSLAVRAQTETLSFLAEVENDLEDDIDAYHEKALAKFTTYVILNRLFVDNCKFFSKELGLDKKVVSNIDWSETGFLVKCLRDYTQHRTLPVTNTTIVYDLVNKTQQVKFTILKKELLENSFRGKQLQMLQSLKMDEITLNDLIIPYGEEIDFLFEKLTDLFINKIDSAFVQYIDKNDSIMYTKHGGKSIDAIYKIPTRLTAREVSKCDEQILMSVLLRIVNKRVRKGEENDGV